VRVGKVNDEAFLGDIAISPATARRNAKMLGRTMASELQVLILHGVLHLLGYDHETDRGQMDRVEARLRRRLGLT
jgi:probable rRNA maturation factor